MAYDLVRRNPDEDRDEARASAASPATFDVRSHEREWLGVSAVLFRSNWMAEITDREGVSEVDLASGASLWFSVERGHAKLVLSATVGLVGPVAAAADGGYVAHNDDGANDGGELVLSLDGSAVARLRYGGVGEYDQRIQWDTGVGERGPLRLTAELSVAPNPGDEDRDEARASVGTTPESMIVSALGRFDSGGCEWVRPSHWSLVCRQQPGTRNRCGNCETCRDLADRSVRIAQARRAADPWHKAPTASGILVGEVTQTKEGRAVLVVGCNPSSSARYVTADGVEFFTVTRNRPVAIVGGCVVSFKVPASWKRTARNPGDEDRDEARASADPALDVPVCENCGDESDDLEDDGFGQVACGACREVAEKYRYEEDGWSGNPGDEDRDEARASSAAMDENLVRLTFLSRGHEVATLAVQDVAVTSTFPSASWDGHVQVTKEKFGDKKLVAVLRPDGTMQANGLGHVDGLRVTAVRGRLSVRGDSGRAHKLVGHGVEFELSVGSTRAGRLNEGRWKWERLQEDRLHFAVALAPGRWSVTADGGFVRLHNLVFRSDEHALRANPSDEDRDEARASAGQPDEPTFTVVESSPSLGGAEGQRLSSATRLVLDRTWRAEVTDLRAGIRQFDLRTSALTIVRNSRAPGVPAKLMVSGDRHWPSVIGRSATICGEPGVVAGDRFLVLSKQGDRVATLGSDGLWRLVGSDVPETSVVVTVAALARNPGDEDRDEARASADPCEDLVELFFLRHGDVVHRIVVRRVTVTAPTTAAFVRGGNQGRAGYLAVVRVGSRTVEPVAILRPDGKIIPQTSEFGHDDFDGLQVFPVRGQLAVYGDVSKEAHGLVGHGDGFELGLESRVSDGHWLWTRAGTTVSLASGRPGGGWWCATNAGKNTHLYGLQFEAVSMGNPGDEDRNEARASAGQSRPPLVVSFSGPDRFPPVFVQGWAFELVAPKPGQLGSVRVDVDGSGRLPLVAGWGSDGSLTLAPAGLALANVESPLGFTGFYDLCVHPRDGRVLALESAMWPDGLLASILESGDGGPSGLSLFARTGAYLASRRDVAQLVTVDGPRKVGEWFDPYSQRAAAVIHGTTTREVPGAPRPNPGDEDRDEARASASSSPPPASRFEVWGYVQVGARRTRMWSGYANSATVTGDELLLRERGSVFAFRWDRAAGAWRSSVAMGLDLVWFEFRQARDDAGPFALALGGPGGQFDTGADMPLATSGQVVHYGRAMARSVRITCGVSTHGARVGAAFTWIAGTWAGQRGPHPWISVDPVSPRPNPGDEDRDEARASAAPSSHGQIDVTGYMQVAERRVVAWEAVVVDVVTVDGNVLRMLIRDGDGATVCRFDYDAASGAWRPGMDTSRLLGTRHVVWFAFKPQLGASLRLGGPEVPAATGGLSLERGFFGRQSSGDGTVFGADPFDWRGQDVRVVWDGNKWVQAREQGEAWTSQWLSLRAEAMPNANPGDEDRDEARAGSSPPRGPGLYVAEGGNGIADDGPHDNVRVEDLTSRRQDGTKSWRFAANGPVGWVSVLSKGKVFYLTCDTGLEIEYLDRPGNKVERLVGGWASVTTWRDPRIGVSHVVVRDRSGGERSIVLDAVHASFEIRPRRTTANPGDEDRDEARASAATAAARGEQPEGPIEVVFWRDQERGRRFTCESVELEPPWPSAVVVDDPRLRHPESRAACGKVRMRHANGLWDVAYWGTNNVFDRLMPAGTHALELFGPFTHVEIRPNRSATSDNRLFARSDLWRGGRQTFGVSWRKSSQDGIGISGLRDWVTASDGAWVGAGRGGTRAPKITIRTPRTAARNPGDEDRDEARASASRPSRPTPRPIVGRLKLEGRDDRPQPPLSEADRTAADLGLYRAPEQTPYEFVRAQALVLRKSRTQPAYDILAVDGGEELIASGIGSANYFSFVIEDTDPPVNPRPHQQFEVTAVANDGLNAFDEPRRGALEVRDEDGNVLLSTLDEIQIRTARNDPSPSGRALMCVTEGTSNTSLLSAPSVSGNPVWWFSGDPDKTPVARGDLMIVPVAP